MSLSVVGETSVLPGFVKYASEEYRHGVLEHSTANLAVCDVMIRLTIEGSPRFLISLMSQ